MKKLILLPLALILLSGTAFASTEMVMHEREFTFSTYYDVESKEGSCGYVVKEFYNIPTCYEYYNAEGQLDSYAKLRLLSLGQIYTWAGTLDVYNAEGRQIALIQSVYATTSPACFYFYDFYDNLLAIAYMDANRMGFTVVDPVNEKRKIATLHRVFVAGVPDHWTVSVKAPNTVDERLLSLFCAYIVDNQGEFKEDL